MIRSRRSRRILPPFRPTNKIGPIIRQDYLNKYFKSVHTLNMEAEEGPQDGVKAGEPSASRAAEAEHQLQPAPSEHEHPHPHPQPHPHPHREKGKTPSPGP